MQKLIFTFLLLLISLFGYSQTYEVGLSLGGTNFVGDIGSTKYFSPTNAGFGMVAKWNRSNRHSFRFSALYLPISAFDEKSDEARKIFRDFEFTNSVKELSLGLEFTWWEWDLHKGGRQTTPYMYTGITVINYGALALATDGTFKAYDDNWSMAIPMVFGVKTNLLQRIILSAEFGARYSFTDNIDGSNPEDLSLPVDKDLNFGNLNTNDWYFYTAITLTYAFGRKPCYCVF